MHLLGEWCRRVWYLLNRRRIDDALRQEMDAHRALMDRPADFGNPLTLREDARAVWGWRWLDRAVLDVRLASRTLRRTPGFTLGAVLSLALGLALATAAVAVTNAYLLQSLPYPGAARLFYVMYAPPGPWEPAGMTALDWTSLKDVVEFPIASSSETFYLSEGGFGQSTRGLRVNEGFIGGLGVRAVAGRALLENDFRAGAEPVALVGNSLWRDRFGSDPGAVGREIHTETEGGRRESFRIVGVLPPDFYVGNDSHQPIDVIVALTGSVRTYMVRLRAGVPRSAAERRLTQAARVVATDLPADWTGVHLESAHERYSGQFRPVLIGITAASGLVLVIVFANVAVLVALRATRRQKEIAVRLALGSGRIAIARMLAAEAGMVSVAALAGGLLLTQLGLGLLAPLIERQLGRTAPGGSASIGIDTTVLFIVAAASAIVAVSLSFLPLLLPWRDRLAEVLRRNGANTTDGRSMRRLRSGMLAFEVAGTLTLLVGCGLMVRSMATMARTDLGFQPDGLDRGRIVLRASDYVNDVAFSRFYEQFSKRVSMAMGGPVVFSSWPPFVDFPEHAIEVDGRAGYAVKAGALTVGAGYCETLGIAIRGGRDITRDDVLAHTAVAVISETMARRLWPNSSAIGQRLRQIEITAGGPQAPGPWQTVVGVAADVRQTYDDRNVTDIYSPGMPTGRFGSFYVRASLSAPALLSNLREAAAGIDPRAVLDPPHAVTDDNRELAGTRFLTMMLAGFSAIAAFIAMLGIYGVTAYAAQQRGREVAIRVALGAERHTVVRMFVRDAGAVIGAGLGMGLIGAICVARVLEHRIFAVRAFDLSTLAGMCGALTAAGLLAAWWPARCAARASPTTTLKDN